MESSPFTPKWNLRPTELILHHGTGALTHLETLKAIDVWLSTSTDVRLAWVTVAITFGLTSTRGWTLAAIAKTIGVSESTLTRSKAKFAKLIRIDGGRGVQFHILCTPSNWTNDQMFCRRPKRRKRRSGSQLKNELGEIIEKPYRSSW